MRDGVCNHSFIRLPNFTIDWEFEPHMTMLKEARREGLVGRGENTVAKSAEKGIES
jgi:hypothetical protein